MQLAVKGRDRGRLGSESFTTMLAAIKMIKAQGWPDPYKRGVEESARPGQVGTTCHISPCSKTRHPTPKSCLTFQTTGYSSAMHMGVSSPSSLAACILKKERGG